MARLHCPHCNKPVSANPLGRWYARFACPHCRGKLQFDTRTNVLGLVGSGLVFVMVYALVMGRTETAQWIAAIAGGLWIACLGLSYGLRRIIKG